MDKKRKPVETVDKVVEKPVYSLVLAVRRHKSGPFAGLWELVKLTPAGEVERVISDANTRSLVMSLASREIAKAS